MSLFLILIIFINCHLTLLFCTLFFWTLNFMPIFFMHSLFMHSYSMYSFFCTLLFHALPSLSIYPLYIIWIHSIFHLTLTLVVPFNNTPQSSIHHQPLNSLSLTTQGRAHNQLTWPYFFWLHFSPDSTHCGPKWKIGGSLGAESPPNPSSRTPPDSNVILENNTMIIRIK